VPARDRLRCASRCSSAGAGHWGGTGTEGDGKCSYVNFCIRDDVDEQRPRWPPPSDGVCRDDGDTPTLVSAPRGKQRWWARRQPQHHMTAATAQSYRPLQDTTVVANRKGRSQTRGKQSTGGRIEPREALSGGKDSPRPGNRNSHGRGDGKPRRFAFFT